MAKFKLNKKSKRVKAAVRYKVEKKVRDHNKKVRRENKKNPKKGKKQKSIVVPNICPFKDDILKEVEALKNQKIAEKQAKKDLVIEERKKQKEAQVEAKKTGGLEKLITNADMRGKLHETLTPDNTKKDSFTTVNKKQENSLKSYYREFKKVIQEADIVLEIVDARDPIGTRCLQVEQAVREAAGNKRLVVVLNKADLVPRVNLDQWLKYFRKSVPAIAFKASTQDQKNTLGRKKMLNARKNDKVMQNSACVGAEILMSLLGNYCRNKGIKTAITVGIVGLPNVGKSSIINSLKRSKACSVGSTPGVTKQMQIVQLDKKIKLLDCPGIVFSSNTLESDDVVALKNAIKVGNLEDPTTPATAILQRANKNVIMDLYNLHEYNSSEEFFAQLAARIGRFKRGGIPDQPAAARLLLEDWNTGKIKYYTLPPEDLNERDIHLDAKIVSSIAKEFDLDSFEAMETEALGTLSNPQLEKSMQISSNGPVEARVMEEQKMQVDDFVSLISDSVNIQQSADKKGAKKPDQESRKRKVDPEMELEGNEQIGKRKKKDLKKKKKQIVRLEKKTNLLAGALENVEISDMGDDYDFSEHFATKDE